MALPLLRLYYSHPFSLQSSSLIQPSPLSVPSGAAYHHVKNGPIDRGFFGVHWDLDFLRFNRPVERDSPLTFWFGGTRAKCHAYIVNCNIRLEALANGTNELNLNKLVFLVVSKLIRCNVHNSEKQLLLTRELKSIGLRSIRASTHSVPWFFVFSNIIVSFDTDCW